MAAMEVVEVEVIKSPNPTETTSSLSSSIPAFEIPPEIISDEEMELIESAFAMAFAAKTTSFISSSTSLLQFHPNPNPNAVSLLSKRNYSTSCGVGDIEDGIGIGTGIRKKRVNNNESFLYRFRRKTGLFVTDITSTVSNAFLFIYNLFFSFAN
ncbi:hypothetical protein OSB04_029305 [Centaurea solstitialis]|uniref:Uncharacterized protein n=1 Tax=Centaurea solstitialis TaxID=347529 RepID=A0AA38SJ04_9ASTR|nr:hypothetical protein OSB04_029305 [Centaurea solstitialis]